MANKRRKLSQEEETIYNKVLKDKTELLRRLEIRLREIDHHLIEGLWLSYLEKKEEFEKRKREMVREITDCKMQVGIAKEFLTVGVPEKEQLKEDKK